jgi:3-oxoacyl-[acyl-carrier protein] reductase
MGEVMSDETGTTGRVAFVTGGSRGIGRAIVLALADAGHRVAFCYSADKDGAAETERLVTEHGGQGLALQADVTDANAVDAAFATIEATWGPVEILVNNAGITRDGLLVRMTDDAWHDVLHTNLTAAFRTTKRAAPKMMRGRFGRIVNVSSVVGLAGGPGQANYAAAKSGLVGLSRSLARELATRNITVNVVAPGPIETAMIAELGADRQDAITAAVPLGRFGTPEECAAVVEFLTRDIAGFVTGAVVPVDGGLGMGH